MIAATVYNMQRGARAPVLGHDDFIGPAHPEERKAQRSADLSSQIKAAFSGRERK